MANIWSNPLRSVSRGRNGSWVVRCIEKVYVWKQIIAALKEGVMRYVGGIGV